MEKEKQDEEKEVEEEMKERKTGVHARRATFVIALDATLRIKTLHFPRFPRPSGRKFLAGPGPAYFETCVADIFSFSRFSVALLVAIAPARVLEVYTCLRILCQRAHVVLHSNLSCFLWLLPCRGMCIVAKSLVPRDVCCAKQAFISIFPKAS